MLAKKDKLNLSKKGVVNIFRQKPHKIGSFNLFIKKRGGRLRMAVVISKKRVPLAVDRNYFKRRLYELKDKINKYCGELDAVLVYSGKVIISTESGKLRRIKMKDAVDELEQALSKCKKV